MRIFSTEFSKPVQYKQARAHQKRFWREGDRHDSRSESVIHTMSSFEENR